MDKFWKWMRRHRYVVWDDGELYFKGSLLEATSAPKHMLIGFMLDYLRTYQEQGDDLNFYWMKERVSYINSFYMELEKRIEELN